MSVLLPLLLLLLTKVMECSRLRPIERCQEARSRSWGGGRWVLMKKRWNHELTLSLLVNLTSTSCATTTTYKLPKHITLIIPARRSKCGCTKRSTEALALTEQSSAYRRCTCGFETR